MPDANLEGQLNRMLANASAIEKGGAFPSKRPLAYFSRLLDSSERESFVTPW